MMTQEEYVNEVLAGIRQGKTIREVAEETGYHPATVSKWLRDGGPPPSRSVGPAELVVDEHWAARLRELNKASEGKLLAKSGFEIIKAEGFGGSYPTVVRFFRDLRGPRFRAAPVISMPIETAPGEEGQFDWSDCSAWTCRWGLGEVFCFELILCWSRYRFWWFATSLDAEHTFEGLVSAYEELGGVPKVSRTDRMGALGRSQGRRFRLHPPAVDFARWHGTELKACQPRDAKRKGKSERPFRDLTAPRGALLYLPRSGEGLEVISLGPMADLDSKEKRDNSMPLNRLSCPGVRGEGPAGPRDMAKAVIA
jgi:transposase